MQETPVTHPGLPSEAYHTLGAKTLWVFVLEKINAVVVLLLLAIGLLILRDQPFVRTTPAGDISGYLALAAIILFAAFVVVFVAIFFISWLTYINYKFALGEDALKIKRGILNKEEIAIPYRQIQDMNIERDLGFRVMGLSRIVIMTAGHEDQKDDPGAEAEGILPALDANLAEWLQAELLKRTNVQKVVEVAPNS